MLGKLQHIGILVKNMDTALEFYVKVLELPLRERRVLPNKTEIAFLPIGSTEIELVSPLEPPENEGLDHLAFLVDDLKGMSKKLGEAGLPVPSNVTLDCSKPTTLFIPGPNGFTFEITQLPGKCV
ncbi:MAG TPA: hypothetical protein GXX51_05590 [Firmicutes bacterium]|nr:hypothetical protein [Bacillota bacterium]